MPLRVSAATAEPKGAVAGGHMSFDIKTVSPPRGGFIGGHYQRMRGAPLELRSPSAPDIVFEEQSASTDDVDRSVSLASTAAKASGWAACGPRDRAQVLHRWADLVDAHLEEIATLEALLGSRPYHEATARDVRVVGMALRLFAAYAETHESAVTATPHRQLSYTRDMPYGVVAAIAPWNFPLILSAWKFAPALAAGNAVVLKPSEMTPFSILRVAELGVEAGLPEGLFNILPGDGGTGQALVRHPGVDTVSFTGSTATGALVMAEAAAHGLKPVSLELGGKGAQLVFADADNLDHVADLIVRGITYNSGQVCFAGSRLIVQAPVRDKLLARIEQRMDRLVAGPTWQEVSLPPIISPAQLARIEQIVATALSQGAKLLRGGEPLADAERRCFFQPTILQSADVDNVAYREEIFGPVLLLDTFERFEEGIAKANHPDFGLAASVYTSNLNAALAAADQLDSGTIWINHWGRAADMTSPFGGVRRSGFGKDMGRAGYQKYLKTKSVWVERADLQ